MPGINIETLDDPLVLERVETFRGGMNSFDTPELLPPDTSQILENMLVPDNFVLRTREGADPYLGAHAPSGGSIQGLSWFSPPAYNNGIVAIAGAAISFRAGGAWSSVAITGMSNWTAGTRMAMAQAVDVIYISDGVNPWVQWTGNGNATILGSNFGTGVSIGDPPKGATIMFWNGVRMFAAGFAPQTPNYQPDTLCASLALSPGNASWDSVLWSIRIGAGDGDPIVAVTPMQNNWILVLKTRSLWLVYADPTATSAANWTVQPLTREIGCVGSRAFAMNGNDIMFLAQDGVRSVRRMAIGVDEYEVVPPVSENVKGYIDRINWSAEAGVAAWRYKQWVLFALPLDGSNTNNNVIVFNTRTQTWMGIWNNSNPGATAWNVAQFATAYGIGVNNANILLLGDTAGNVHHWKDDNDPTLALTWKDNGYTYQPRMRSRTFLFQDPVAQKDPRYFELRLLNATVTGTLNLTVNFYTDDNQYPSVTITAQPNAPILGQIVLPFTLTGAGPLVSRVPLDAMQDFNQLYLDVLSPGGGLIEIKNFTLGAYLNTIQDDVSDT